MRTFLEIFNGFFQRDAFSAKRGIAIAYGVRLSVTLVDQDHIGRKAWKLIARTISPAQKRHISETRKDRDKVTMGSL